MPNRPAKEKARALARMRALTALAERYPDEFTALHNAEREAVGLKPVTNRELKRGTRACYVTKCGHEECRAANAEYQRAYMYLHRRGIEWNTPGMEDY